MKGFSEVYRFFNYIEFSFYDVPYGFNQSELMQGIAINEFSDIWVETEIYFLHKIFILLCSTP